MWAWINFLQHPIKYIVLWRVLSGRVLAHPLNNMLNSVLVPAQSPNLSEAPEMNKTYYIP